MKPNILFLLIDALRADRCYGSKKTSKTPNLDKLIKEGTLFENAFSSSDGTPVSFASIFTGVYPFQCALRKGRWNFKLNDEITNFITLLKKNGYHCYATMPELWVVEEFNPAASVHQSYRLKRLAIRLAHECRQTPQQFFNAIGQDR